MKKIFSCFLLLTILAAFTSDATSQVTRTTKKKPLFTIDANAGYDLAMSDLKGEDLGGLWNFTDYGQKGGIGAELKFKLSVMTQPMNQLRTTFTLGYQQYTNNDSRAYVPFMNIEPGWPGTGFNGTGTYTPDTTAGTSEFTMNIPQAGFGIEYAIYMDKMNNSSIDLGLDLLLNYIFGKHTENYANGEVREYDLQSNSRFGLGIYAMFNYRFADAVGFNIGTKYQMHNLIGKDVKATQGDGEFFLLDGDDTTMNPLLNSSRNIGSLRFFGGLSFYIGRR